MPKHYDHGLDRVFNALSDSTRRDVLARLASEGEATVGALAAAYAMALPSFSEHLGVLERASLISRTREGRHHRIGLRPEGLEALRTWLEAVAPSPQGQPPSSPPPTHPEEGMALLRRAEAFCLLAAPQMAIVDQVLDPPKRRASLEAQAFSPEGHAVRALALAALEDPELRHELQEAHSLHAELSRQLAIARRDGQVQSVAAAVFPLARRLYAWRKHPILKEAFPITSPCAA